MSDDIGVAQVQEWADGLAEIGELIGPRFARSEPRANAVAYPKGLLSPGTVRDIAREGESRDHLAL